MFNAENSIHRRLLTSGSTIALGLIATACSPNLTENQATSSTDTTALEQAKVLETPTPPAKEPILINDGPTDKPKIALTFDADMTLHMQDKLRDGSVKSWYNKAVIDVLRENKTPATIFMTGLWANNNNEAAKNIAHDPLFEIGNHSYDHAAFTEDCYGLPSISDSESRTNIQMAQKDISSITGVTPKYFRFPGLCHDEHDLQAVADSNLVAVDGVGSGDAGSHNTDAIVSTTLKQAANGKIVVMHLHGDGGLGKGYAPKTAEALKQIIPKLTEQYQLVTLSDLLETEQS